MDIRVLAPEVINKIAAGEVLDRPANLIKELVENSLDAGATEIEVDFDNGGRNVCVRDNGAGIRREDLRLALERHATSKIQDHEDLFRLDSFGFRGEALASIAAVSDLTLTSRTIAQNEAAKLYSRYGTLEEIVSVSASPGTTIRVENLFENVPARLKFLKSEAAEHTQIKTTLKALALANEKVGFTIRTRGELVERWPAGQDFFSRGKSVLAVESLFSGTFEQQGVQAEVLVSSPEHTSGQNRNIWFFVQGRWIQDRALNAAVMEAYRGLLMHQEYPTAVVRIRMPTDWVDVNVHPTKSQVKFRDSQLMFRVTCRAVRSVLEKAPWLQSSEASQDGPRPSSVTGANAFTSRFQQNPESANLIFSGAEFAKTQYSTKMFPLAQVREAVAAYEISGEGGGVNLENNGEPNPANRFLWASLQVIGQINHTYIVAQNQEAMYLVDQHAAHERVVYERLMQDFHLGRIEVQHLLLPLIVDLTQVEVEALVPHQADLEKMGLSVERMGPDSVAVQALPTLISEAAIATALKKLAFELCEQGDSLAWEKVVSDVFASMACHSVVRAGQAIGVDQMKSLLVQMDEFPLSSFCPHGRPVFIRRRFTDLDREFGRIV